MKKSNTFFLKTFALLALLFIFPSCVNASDFDSSKNNTINLSNELTNIDTLATPYITEFTLDHGEFFDLTRKVVFHKDTIDLPCLFIQAKPSNGLREAFSISSVSNLNEDRELRASTPNFSFGMLLSSGFRVIYRPVSPNEFEIYDYGIRVTNYSAGAVTFKAGVNVSYDGQTPYFDLD